MDETILDQLTADLVSGADILAGAPKGKRGRGKAIEPLVANITRELTLEDVQAANGAAVGVSQAPPLQQLRATHHRLAQLMAQGFAQTDVARITGYSPARISILKNDPAFKELLSHYGKLKEEAFVDTVHRMKDVTDDALDLLQERIHDEPDSITTPALVEVISKIGDRAGFSPVAKSVNLNLPVDGAALQQLKERVKERQSGSVKQIKQEEINADYIVVQGDQGSPVGGGNGSPQPVRQAAQTQGGAGQGDHI